VMRRSKLRLKLRGSISVPWRVVSTRPASIKGARSAPRLRRVIPLGDSVLGGEVMNGRARRHGRGAPAGFSSRPCWQLRLCAFGTRRPAARALPRHFPSLGGRHHARHARPHRERPSSR
jgi:hypothetical protein